MRKVGLGKLMGSPNPTLLICILLVLIAWIFHQAWLLLTHGFTLVFLYLLGFKLLGHPCRKIIFMKLKPFFKSTSMMIINIFSALAADVYCSCLESLGQFYCKLGLLVFFAKVITIEHLTLFL